MEKFILDEKFDDLIKHFGIDVSEMLKKAKVAEDIFLTKNPSMTKEEYFRFMDNLGKTIKSPEIIIKMATVEHIETFSPPIFASYSSNNGITCIERLSRYKKLISPLIMDVKNEGENFTVEYRTSDADEKLPQFLVEVEVIFLVNILRRATKENVVPVNVSMTQLPKYGNLNNYLGVVIKESNKNVISFKKTDLLVPFISYNESMLKHFEPELARRLSDLDKGSTISVKVQAALTELLPSGKSSIEDVAKKLNVSKRTMQRRLNEDGITFRQLLNSVREKLAIHYLSKTNMSSYDIAYLLGYEEINSFLRAFSYWVGKNVSQYRKTIIK